MNDVDIYKQLNPKLTQFFPLVQHLNSTQQPLTHDELKNIFSKIVTQDIIRVGALYAKTNFKRTCGNPIFSHAFRTALWTKIIGCEEKTIRLAVFHDFLEDFSETTTQLKEHLIEIPKELQPGVFALTNTYSLLVKEVQRKTKNSYEALQLLQRYEDSDFIRDEIMDISEELSKNTPTTLQKIKRDSYKKYIEKSVAYYEQTKDEDPITVKLADRLDNTLTDWPSKFSSIIKIYSKNELVLMHLKTSIHSLSLQTKIMYSLLLERSIDQLELLIKNYTLLVEKRGVFYGKQYEKLKEKLEVELHKIKQLEPIKNKIMTSKEMQTYLKKICN